MLFLNWLKCEPRTFTRSQPFVILMNPAVLNQRTMASFTVDPTPVESESPVFCCYRCKLSHSTTARPAGDWCVFEVQETRPSYVFVSQLWKYCSGQNIHRNQRSHHLSLGQRGDLKKTQDPFLFIMRQWKYEKESEGKWEGITRGTSKHQSCPKTQLGEGRIFS